MNDLSLLAGMLLGGVALAVSGLTFRRLTALANRTTSLEARLIQSNDEIRHLSSELELAIERIPHIEGHGTQLRNDIDQLIERVRTLEQERTGLRNDVNRLVERVHAIEKDRTVLAVQLASLTGKNRPTMPRGAKPELGLTGSLTPVAEALEPISAPDRIRQDLEDP